MKEINFFLNPPFFYFHGNCSKVCPTDSDFCGLSRSTRCGCERKHYCKTLCEVWSEFNIFCTLVTMATAAILNFFNPSKAVTLRWIFLQSFMTSDESNFFLNPPFFVSMATAAKFVQPITIFLVYLVPLDMDVVPIKFHQFLFGE